jgi:putative peptide zinc metalloprotease protein
MEKDLHLAEEGIKAPFSGIVSRLDVRIQEGFQPGKGTVVGELKSNLDCVVRVLVPEHDRSRLSKGQTVHVWFPVSCGRIYTDRISEIMHFSEKDLRNSPFSSRYGGEIATEIKGEAQRDAPLDAQYVGQVPFRNAEGLPLGLTGRCSVESTRESLFNRMVSGAAKAFNRETIF